MKEETLIIMKNKVESLTRVVQHLLTEVTNLRELGIGTLETLKLTPDYDKALEQLKQNMIKQQEEEKLKDHEKEKLPT
tara:strand:- start:787 stop:1020 length:234 start_codon:yes stop_codon:yes gene_type:complete